MGVGVGEGDGQGIVQSIQSVPTISIGVNVVVIPVVPAVPTPVKTQHSPPYSIIDDGANVATSPFAIPKYR